MRCGRLLREREPVAVFFTGKGNENTWKILAFNMKYIKENATSDAIPIVFTDNNDIRLINGSAVYKANEDMLEIETE